MLDFILLLCASSRFSYRCGGVVFFAFRLSSRLACCYVRVVASAFHHACLLAFCSVAFAIGDVLVVRVLF